MLYSMNMMKSFFNLFELFEEILELKIFFRFYNMKFNNET